MKGEAMAYNIAPLDLTPAELDGLSERLIVSHYENNYGGAVRRLNAIVGELARLDLANTPGYVINGLKREELVALNSTLLHELYFASMGGEGKVTKAMTDALARDFGSVQRWRTEFSAMGYALGGGSGWVLLTWMPRDGRLINQYASDHSQAVASGVPILALDMYEHAYHIDFGARAAAYVDAFMRNIDWNAAALRFQAAVGVASPMPSPDPAEIAPETLRAAIQANKAPMILDVRRRKALDAGADMIQGAQWREPERVAEWAGAVPLGQEIAVYCVYGHNVSHDTIVALRAQGVDARALRGGIAAWHAIGGPTSPKPG
jgi:Fe-Mn family superoxide dismutase